MKRRKREPAPPGCYNCKGTGLVAVTIKGVEAMEKCECPKGTWLRQQERKREFSHPTGA